MLCRIDVKREAAIDWNRSLNGIGFVKDQEIGHAGLGYDGLGETFLDGKVCSCSLLDAVRSEIFLHREVSQFNDA